MRKILKENGLSLVLLLLFLFSIFGQSITGHHEHNQERQEHGQASISYTEYLISGHFLEAVFENWESEFLQMAAYVLLTVFLYQKGSSESKRPDVIEEVDLDPRESPRKKTAPWPVQHGGWVLRVYENSLSLALFILFAASFLLHAVGGAQEYNREQLLHGQSETVTTIAYMRTARFWHESFQNWQSEFLSIGAMVVLTIFLRQRGSPESKPVDSPHSETAG